MTQSENPKPESSATAAPRLLLLEQESDTATLYRQVFSDHFGSDQLTHVPSLKLAHGTDLSTIDLIVTNMELPDATGFDVLHWLEKSHVELPVVVVTSEGDSSSAAQVIRKGAYDYVVKAGDYLLALPLIIEKNLAIWKTRLENQRLQRELSLTLKQLQLKNRQLHEVVQRLQTMAATDELTGLANRRAMHRAFDRALAAANRHDHDVACVMIDLDGFKQLNDTAGHPAGDEILKIAARVLEANCRRSDIAGRWGGDEFVLLLPHVGLPDAQCIAVRVFEEFCQASIAFTKRYPNAPVVSMSLGLASLRQTSRPDAQTLVAQADQALYQAKQQGKGRIILCETSVKHTSHC